jgi:Ser/Thr protein kinase RdoA (MazF antagonist)
MQSCKVDSMPGPIIQPAPQFGSEVAAGVLDRACQVVGLSTSGALALRLGENALFHLPRESVVVRIARTLDYWADAVNEVNVARWLAEQGFPAAEVVDVEQPIAVEGHPVTFWRFIEGRSGDRDDIGALGSVLRRLHALPRPTNFELPHENILGRVHARIAKTPVPDVDKEFLLCLLSELGAAVDSLQFPLKPSPTHGDAHSENIMICGGQAVLIDFERFAWGQPEWDLAMTATEYLTAGWWTAEEYHRFVNAYGYDVTSWTDGFDVLRRVHELKMTTWLMQNVNESAEVADEYQVRMRSIRDGISSGWRPF